MTAVQVLSLAFLISLCQNVHGHGRLMDPPGRSSMWRFPDKYPRSPTNYNDNQLFCGGRQHMIQMGGRCGVCGDPYDGNRENEAGGIYATGMITRHYTAGQVIDVDVEVTANHKGYFEFRLCPNNNPSTPATQECMDQHVLQLDGSTNTKSYIGKRRGHVITRVRLPAGLTCTQCVLQWYWKTGNSWGRESDGKYCMGCGMQESFLGCADIAISGSGGGSPYYPTNAPVQHPTQPPQPTQRPQLTQRPPQTQPPYIVLPGAATGNNFNRCHGINLWKGVMDNWCQTNCALGNCPATACSCA